MKRIILAGAMIFFFNSSAVHAQFSKRDADSLGSTETIVTQRKVVANQGGTQQGALAEKKTELNGTEWTVTMTSSGSAVKGKGVTDVITFGDGNVSSKNLKDEGFATSNFSLRMQEDGTMTWETMQTSEKAGFAFWRGDIGSDGIMRGVLSKRDKKDKTTDFNFVSTDSQKTAPVLAPAATEETAAE